MLDALTIGPQDRVVEFAPGLGVTARIVLKKGPSSYLGVEREPSAVEQLRNQLASTIAEIVQGEAQKSGLLDGSASVIYGEAMLSMHRPEQKNRIFAEARRLLEPYGRYGIRTVFSARRYFSFVATWIQAELSKEIHVGFNYPRPEWIATFERNGMAVTWSSKSPYIFWSRGAC
jgi:SAM-dependent methyltransferase